MDVVVTVQLTGVLSQGLASEAVVWGMPAGWWEHRSRSGAWARWAACADPSAPQAMRTLSWKHNLGLVTMDVELADRTLSVAVTPVQAVVLLYFQDQGERAGGGAG